MKENLTMNLNQATVFVTGANRGIGRAIVGELRKQGVKRIYAAARKINELDSIAGDLVTPICLDITDVRAVAAAAEQAGDTTVLINNAGVLSPGSLLDSPTEMIARNFDTNFYGTLNMVRAFAPVIESTGGGAIVNVLTVVSMASMSSFGGYSASKAAGFSMTQAVRKELKSRGITVHGVYPGPVDTEMADSLEMPKTSPQEVAAAIVEGINNNEEDIFPDAMSRQLSQTWLSNPKELERMFASM
jgi:NAD(P)-dependent dehydrogenase (short-subunit alcohol dehydrogenase family)